MSLSTIGLTALLSTLVVPGQVTFSKSAPLESEALKTFAWCERCELNLRVSLQAPLLSALHELAPDLAEDELLKSGNAQFTFIVDGKTVYLENLNVGAGTPQTKRTATSFRVPLISPTDEDSWGRFLWMRFMLRGGGEEALAEGSHSLTLEVRPYLKRAAEVKVGPLLAAGSLLVTVARPVIDEQRVAVQGVQPGSGFVRSKAPLDQHLVRELNRQIAQRVFKDITSLVVLCDGQLVLEEYFNGASRETLHDVRSVGKSFASALTGLALRDGHLKSVRQNLGALYDLKAFANPSDEKAAITVSDLLTMSSGLDGDDSDDSAPGMEEHMYPAKDWVKFTLDLPMKEGLTRGKDWVYVTAGVVLLGDILDRSVPGGLEQYADRSLFKPLGIRGYTWARMPNQKISTAGGLRMRALDLAKFGQLYKDRGRWSGAAVLPEEWVKASLAHQVSRPDGGSYGYLFWSTSYSVAGAPFEAMNASGNGGNKIFVFTDQPYVVVVTSTAYNQPYAHSQVDRLMQRLVLPALGAGARP